MSKQRYNWWPYALNMIRDYPSRKMELDALHEQKITASTSGIPGGGGSPRTVEQLALRQLPHAEQEEFDAVDKALNRVRMMSDAADRLKVIQLTLFQNYRIFEAERKLNLSARTIRRYRYQFIATVGWMHGRIEESEYWTLIRNDLGNEKRTPNVDGPL